MKQLNVLVDFVEQRFANWLWIAISAVFFTPILYRCLFLVAPFSYLQTLGLLLSIGLIADFVALVVKKPV